MLKFPVSIHPGSGYRKSTCDVCGKTCYVKDMTKITDKNNTLYGLVVCRADADQTNPQSIPFTIKEDLIPDPTTIRDMVPDSYVTTETLDRASTPPTNLRLTINYLNDSVNLAWDGPLDVGTGRIIQYKVYYAIPQTSTLFELGSTEFTSLETTLTPDIEYRVSVVTEYGESVKSDPLYYTSKLWDTEYTYLCESQTGDSLALTTGEFLIYGN